LNTVGYADVFAFLRGEIEQNELSRIIGQNTRRYAKRQMTWFRRDGRIRWIDVDHLSAGDIAAGVVKAFQEGG
jgi:tRNA dimethylallyltransferase